MHLRAFTVVVSLFCALAACHGVDKRNIVRLEVFEDHVSVNGVPSDLPYNKRLMRRLRGVSCMYSLFRGSR